MAAAITGTVVGLFSDESLKVSSRMIGSSEVVPCERSIGNVAEDPGLGGAGEYQRCESKRRKFKS